MAAGTVTIRLESPDGSDDEIRRLARWLRDEDELRGRVELRNEPLQQGQMGGLTDAIVVGVSSGGLATVLVSSLFTWLTSRRDANRVTVAAESASGRKFDITCGSPDDAERLLRALRDALDEDA